MSATTKLQDGSMIQASILLDGNAKDEEGKPIKFEPLEGSTYPTYQAETTMNDGSGNIKRYSFSLENTMVRVSCVIQTPEQLKVNRQSNETRQKEEGQLKAQGQKQQQKQQTQQPKEQQRKAIEKDQNPMTRLETQKSFKESGTKTASSKKNK